MNRRALSAWLLAAASSASMLACSEGEPVHETSTTSGGDGASGGAGGGGTAQGTGGAGGDMMPDPGPEVCPNATGVYDVKPAQTNLLFLLDRSGSMHLRVQGDDTRWSLTTAGLSSILAALPQSTVAGLEMFPSGDQPVSCCAITSGNYIDCGACGSGELPGPNSRCSTIVYGDFSVDMGALSPAHADSITAAAQSSNDEFYWGTPLAPALGGTISGLTSYQLPGVTSIVLLTDGLPTSCETSSDPNANDINRALAAATVGAQNGIRTYVVGIDADAASSDPTSDLAINLSAVAQAGGTGRYVGCDQNDDCAYVVNSDNFQQALADALADIALEATSCSIELPDVQGGTPDYDAVNITVTSAGQTMTIPRDQSKQDGWDYLPGNQQVQLYGDPCELLKNDAQAKVTVVVGCKTEQI